MSGSVFTALNLLFSKICDGREAAFHGPQGLGHMHRHPGMTVFDFHGQLRPHSHNRGMLYIFFKSHFVKMTLLKSFRLNECDLCNVDLKSCQFIT